MNKNEWFFWIDRLHITKSERYFLSGLTGFYLLLWAINPFLGADNPYDDEYYAPLMEAFYERTAERYEEKRELLERYYPGQPDTIESLARALIPPEFEPEIQQVIEMRQQVPPSTSIVQADTTKPERPPDSVRININTATLTELTKLPGIGPSIAARIIEYREQNGSFKRVDDITNVRGIGQTRLEQLREILEI